LRCPNCKQFAKFNTNVEPLAENKTFQDGIVMLNVRLVNSCLTCKREMCEYIFHFAESVREAMAVHNCPNAHVGVGWAVKLDSLTRHERLHPPNKKVQVRFYAVRFEASLHCNCEEGYEYNFARAAEVKASDMVPLV
jgi:hypothetical protein